MSQNATERAASLARGTRRGRRKKWEAFLQGGGRRIADGDLNSINGPLFPQDTDVSAFELFEQERPLRT
jgi:hypothetical protein